VTETKIMNKQLILAVTVMFTAAGFAGLLAESSDGAGFDVTDGTERIFHYESPSEHIVLAGYAVALTVADLGLADKIVATDTYGGYEAYKNPKLEVIRDVPSIGSIFSSANNTYIIAQLVQWVEEGRMLLDDTIVFTAYANSTVLREALEKEGFTHILVWGSITEYGKIADMVDSVSLALTGSTSTLAEEMRLVEKEVAEKTAGVEKKKAIFVEWSSVSGFKVGKTGSLAVSIIEAAGGKSLGENSASGGTYGDVNTIIQLLENNHDALVLLNNAYYTEYGIEKFRADVLGGDEDFNIMGMEQTWNNYCPESTDGLWAIAGELYPELFGGVDRPKAGGNGSDNTLIYIALGAAAVVAIIALAVYFTRKP
jgi:ABC-type Fe3+-hydroxamate transport system substrate-binding protein